MKKSIFIALTFVGTTLLITACSKSGDDNKPPAKSDIPKALVFSKPTQGEKLTRTQVDQIKSSFGTKSTMILPPGDLIFTPQSMTPAAKEQKELALKVEDKNSYELLKMIQKDCRKIRPTSHIEATFPIDGEDAKKSLKSGDYYKMDVSGGLASDGCPVDFLTSMGLDARVEDRDLDADTGRASYKSNLGIKALIKNPKFAHLLGGRGIAVQTSISGLVVSREVSKDKPSSRQMLQLTLDGTYLSLDQDIPFSLTMQTVTTENEGSDTIVHAHLQMKNFSFDMDIHSLKPSATSPGIQEVYLNGYPVTQADIDNLFGKSSPGQVANQTAAFLK